MDRGFTVLKYETKKFLYYDAIDKFGFLYNRSEENCPGLLVGKEAKLKFRSVNFFKVVPLCLVRVTLPFVSILLVHSFLSG
jgi:hypothetical protein